MKTKNAGFAVPQLDAETAVNLGQVLESSDFTEQLPDESGQSFTSQSVLQRLFTRGEAVAIRQAERAFPAQLLGKLVRAGLLVETDRQLCSLFQAQRYRGMTFLVDFFGKSQPADFVLPVGPAGQYLADLTIRKPVLSALDLGCGCGVQSLLAAKHCAQVSATDINPRALQFTRLNVAINRIPNIEILEGSFLEPVRGRSFDLIVANLPYVITPENTFSYRDAGEGRDAILYDLLRQLPDALNENGFAHILANWTHAFDQSFWKPLSVPEIVGRGTWMPPARAIQPCGRRWTRCWRQTARVQKQ